MLLAERHDVGRVRHERGAQVVVGVDHQQLPLPQAGLHATRVLDGHGGVARAVHQQHRAVDASGHVDRRDVVEARADRALHLLEDRLAKPLARQVVT